MHLVIKLAITYVISFIVLCIFFCVFNSTPYNAMTLLTLLAQPLGILALVPCAYIIEKEVRKHVGGSSN